MAKGNEELKEASDRQIARGELPSQKELKAYHEGDFQTTDPVTGEPRDNTGGTWQEQDELADNIIGTETSPDDLRKEQEEEVARSAGPDAAPRSARKSGAKKAARKGKKAQ